MFVIGAVMGSFLCCQVRRAQAREESLKKNGAKEEGLKKGKKNGARELGKWSVCMKCGRRLKWWEKVPIVSWVCLRGRCHGCGAKIGAAEILAEVGGGIMGVMLAVGTEYITGEWVMVVIFAMVGLYLAIYDGIEGVMPRLGLTFLWICAILIVILRQWSLVSVGAWSLEQGNILGMVGGLGVLGGVYLLLYIGSRGRWVGDGDWILAGALGVVLGSPWLSLVALFVANVVACVVMWPAVRKKKERVVYMGPFLLTGFVVAYGLAGWLVGLVG